MAPVLGVVPVLLDDDSAPFGTAALRTLRGRTLVERAVGALVRSGVVDRVTVVGPAALRGPLAEVLEPGGSGSVAVGIVTLPQDHRPARSELPGSTPRVVELVRCALESATDTTGDSAGETAADWAAVVVHDPLHPLAPSSLVRQVLSTLRDDGTCAAAVPVRAVTDTLKWVDGEDVVVATVDRSEYRMVYSPQAYRFTALAGALQDEPEELRHTWGAHLLPSLVQRRGGTLLSVPAPSEVFRVASAEDLLLAEAMLQVGADSDDEPSPAR